MPTLSEHTNVYSTAVSILRKKGFQIWRNKNWARSYAERDGWEFRADSFCALLGLVAIFEFKSPKEFEPRWWYEPGPYVYSQLPIGPERLFESVMGKSYAPPQSRFPEYDEVQNSTILILRRKGFQVWLWKRSDGVDTYCAERDGWDFMANTPCGLLGLVSIFEFRAPPKFVEYWWREPDLDAYWNLQLQPDHPFKKSDPHKVLTSIAKRR